MSAGQSQMHSTMTTIKDGAGGGNKKKQLSMIEIEMQNLEKIKAR